MNRWRTPGHFSPVRNKHVFESPDKELFQVTGIGHHPVIYSNSKAGRQDTFYGCMDLRWTHEHRYSQGIVGPFVITDRHQLHQDKNILWLEDHLSFSFRDSRIQNERCEDLCQLNNECDRNDGHYETKYAPWTLWAASTTVDLKSPPILNESGFAARNGLWGAR